MTKQQHTHRYAFHITILHDQILALQTTKRLFLTPPNIAASFGMQSLKIPESLTNFTFLNVLHLTSQPETAASEHTNKSSRNATTRREQDRKKDRDAEPQRASEMLHK